MRKFLIAIVAILATAMTITSCDNSNKEGTYNFFRQSQFNALQAADIQAYISATDPYLASGSQNQRTGKYGEVCSLEIETFVQHCEALDGAYIKSKLGLDEYYRIDLYVYNPLARLVSVRWTNDGFNTFKE